MSDDRTALKKAVERGLGFAFGSARHRLNRDRALILAFHNVLPDGTPIQGDRSLHLEATKFREFLDVIEELCTIKPLAEILEPGPTPRPPVALTFDDAYAGFIEAALPELTRRGHPCTVFVCPGLLGAQGFWWDSLSGPEGLSPLVRDAAMEQLRGIGSEIVAFAATRGLTPKALPRAYWAATENQLMEAVHAHDCTLGIHTWDHPRLDSLSDLEIRDQLTRTWNWLRERFPEQSIPWVCYPYGHFDKRVAAISHTLGLAGGLKVDGGWVRNPAQRFQLPRLTIPSGLSVPGLRLRITGVVER